MGAKRDEGGSTPQLSLISANEVRLVGRLTAPAEERVLASEAVMCTFMMAVERQDNELRSGQRVDVLSCIAWKPRLRRQVLAWIEGDVVEVQGALRKRFFRLAGGTTASRVEVEVGSARRIRRMTA
ncbi:single-stranded DNA-binding protein [Nocardioides sp. BP30]|uniref:single-stranded DNA-binding protein n=1 Tax=Nocardioides sp. BP30 TaxID=3036374 RepID=UPI00246826E5|nr:single-stranded DNA-binding protein [Nocardioides sp. BP30]WGL50513.1 single-stranded DNA-binding protein [Nocardioides sp. BP30]